MTTPEGRPAVPASPDPSRLTDLPPGRGSRHRRAAPALVVGAGLAGLLAVTPLVYLAVRALERGPAAFLEILNRPRTGDLLVATVVLASSVTVACVVIGVVGAWLVVRTDLPGRRLWGVLLALPLAVPSYVAGFTWISEFPRLAGFSGAFLVLTIVSYPYVFLTAAAALRGGGSGLEEVARSLGHGPLRVLFTVTLRRVWPAALAGGLLVALYVLGDFGAVSLMRYDAFTTGIYTAYRATFDRIPAAVLGCVLVAMAALLTWAEARARGRVAAQVGRGVDRQPATVELGHGRIAGLGFVVTIVVVSLGVPAYSLVRWMVIGSSVGVDLPALATAAFNTVRIAGLGALITTALALPVGILAARHRNRITSTLEGAAYLGFALPGVTVGLALVFVGIRLVPGLYQQLPLLIVGYAVLFLPLAVGAVRTAVAMAPPQLEEVSRSLGKGRLATLARVTVPLAAPGVAAGGAFVFLAITKELPATLMLRPTGTDTLAVALWTSTDAGQFAAAAPYAAVIVLVAAVPTLVLDRVMRRGAS